MPNKINFNIKKLKAKDIKFDPFWIETVDRTRVNAYSDTDSSYQIITLPFNKFEDVHKTVDYTQEVATSINDLYLDVLNTTLAEHANLDPDFNLMNFKSEVVAFRGFFRSKKYYGLAKIWDEGNFLPKPKLKKTGGQIVKADTTQISYEFLSKIYEYFVLNFEITDKAELYKKVFIDLRNEYIQKLKKDIHEFNISSFGIPKKWGLKDFKVLPKQVLGAMLYNTIFENVLRPGDSIMLVQIKIKNLKKILDLQSKLKKENKLNEYQLTKDLINDKLNVISFPSGIDKHPEKIENLKKVFQQYDIELDLDTIIDFNIDMKLIQFDVLFEDEIKRKVLK